MSIQKETGIVRIVISMFRPISLELDMQHKVTFPNWKKTNKSPLKTRISSGMITTFPLLRKIVTMSNRLSPIPSLNIITETGINK